MVAALALDGVTKRYGPQTALRDVTLTIPQGAVVGCAGPGGSGKSTLLKLAVGLVRPSAGRISVLGGDVGSAKVKARVGYCSEVPLLRDHMTVWTFLFFCGRLLGWSGSATRARMVDLIERLDLEAMADRPIRTLPKPHQQRVNLAQAVLADPDLLLMDEPLNGLDADGGRLVREILRERKARGQTTLVTSHRMDELETLCDDLLVLRDGQCSRWTGAGLAGESLARVVFTPPHGFPRYLMDGAVPLTAGQFAQGVPREELGQWLVALVESGGTVHTVLDGDMEGRREAAGL